MPRALIIAYYWPPAGGGGVQRWLKFVRYLPEFGWQPVVYVPANPQYPLEDTSLLTQVPAETEVIRGQILEARGIYQKLKALTGKKSGEKAADMDTMFFRDPSELSWFGKLSLLLRSNFFIPDARSLWIKPSVRRLRRYLKEHPVDLIISTGPPHSCHLIAMQLKADTGIPWIADFRDPWLDIDYFPLLRMTHYARRRHEQLQHRVLTQADRVITVSWSWAELFQGYGATEVNVITNGFDPADLPEMKPGNTDDTTIRITAVGTLERDRAPVGLWQALEAEMQERPEVGDRIQIHLAGKVDEAALPEVKRVRALIHNHGYVSHEKALALMQEADILLLLLNQNSTANAKGRIPGKLFEYLAMRKPILMLGDEDTDAGRLITGLGNSWCVHYGDHAALRVILQEYLSNGKHIEKEPEMDLTQYERRALTRRLAGIMRDVSGTQNQ